MATDTVADWLAVVDAAYPQAEAAEWDNVGLQVGDPTWRVERVLVTLDVTLEVIEEAAGVARTLLLAHHPLLFRPLRRLAPDTAAGRLALRAAADQVAVISAHTNLDVATDGAGTSQPVADLLKLAHQRPLMVDTRESADVKLVTFVPPEALDAVVNALGQAGAGIIGDYDHCTFRSPGTGAFKPGERAHPYSGSRGELTHEDEFRLETVVAKRRLPDVLHALRAAHPYEEVAYDLYPLVEGGMRGLGIVGSLPTPLPLREVAETIARDLPAPHLRYAGTAEREVGRVAVVGGAGDSLIGAAQAAGVDVFITGDLRHHVTLGALTMGLAVIDAGHHATESAAMPAFAERLRERAVDHGLSAAVLASQTSTVPWR